MPCYAPEGIQSWVDLSIFNLLQAGDGYRELALIQVFLVQAPFLPEVFDSLAELNAEFIKIHPRTLIRVYKIVHTQLSVYP